MWFYRYIIAMVMILSLHCSSLYAQQTFVQQSNRNDIVQGLKTMRDKAIAFVNEDNQKNHTYWKILEPNAKIVVYKCMSPLVAKWGALFMDGSKANITIERYVIFVSCKKDIKNRSWTVQVPTNRPDRVTIN